RGDAVELKVAAEEGKLSVQSGSGPATKLEAIDKTSFKTSDGSVTITFQSKGDKVSRLTLKRDTNETVFQRVEAAKAVEAGTATVEDIGGVVKSPLNWPSFRGPNASGVADGQFPPL